ncbi:hypothetical protein [Asticcacaulis sp. AND118]|uniref:hypothetical protein n=1 Tax=Asticcacaulis sp. AND118 TaxID=2840468 RepID=UPI001CFF742E|nr:hypothetical protein [Asticcacaulis sp. AND118]UDF04061.1 hypothetical protein LH365_03165 [Asticcacaulis sp. AND118]
MKRTPKPKVRPAKKGAGPDAHANARNAAAAEEVDADVASHASDASAASLAEFVIREKLRLESDKAASERKNEAVARTLLRAKVAQDLAGQKARDDAQAALAAQDLRHKNILFYVTTTSAVFCGIFLLCYVRPVLAAMPGYLQKSEVAGFLGIMFLILSLFNIVFATINRRGIVRIDQVLASLVELVKKGGGK